MILSIIDGSIKYDFLNAGIAAIVSIIMVFLILGIIIGITSLIFKLIDMIDSRKKSNPIEQVVENAKEIDDDMMAAILVASIDYQEQVKKDVRLVSIKEIK